MTYELKVRQVVFNAPMTARDLFREKKTFKAVPDLRTLELKTLFIVRTSLLFEEVEHK